jgi:DNA-binding NtrC family response regulator
MSPGNVLELIDLAPDSETAPPQETQGKTDFALPALSLREMEEKLILRALEKTNGNRTHAAKILGISIRTLRNKLNEYKQGFSAPLKDSE